MTRRAARIALGVLLPAVTACALVPSGGSSPTFPSATPVASAQASASPPSWTVETLSHDDPQHPAHVQWPVVPGATTLQDLLATELGERYARFLGDTTPSMTAPPELVGTWEPVFETASWIGIRMVVREFAGAAEEESSRVYIGERTAGQAFPAIELVAPQARPVVVEAVLADLRRQQRPVVEDLLTTQAMAQVLDDLTFGPRGELLVRVAAGVVLAAGEGRVEVTVAPSVVDGVLSEQGRKVRDAVTGVVEQPAPSPTFPVMVRSGAASGGAVDCAAIPCVALTFDDGPGPHTERLLDVLAAERAPATFFVLGSAVRVHPDLVRRMVAEGHDLGNHTHDHRLLASLGAQEQRAEVARTASVLAEVGVEATLLRPPYGAYDATTREVAGLPIVVGDVDTFDWRTRSAEATVAAAVDGAQAGSIVVMRDIHATTVDAVPAVVAGLRDKGFTLVTASTLLGAREPGSVSSRR